MSHEDILREVSEYEPELMDKTAQAIALTSKLYPAFAPGIFEDFEVILGTVEEKTASIADLAKKVPEGAKRVGLALGATAGAALMSALATDLYDAARRGISKGSNFKRIMEANPTLKKEVDSKKLTMAFNAIHRFAPDFTADPMVGGALLRQVADLPEMSVKMMQDLISSQSSLNNAKSKHFQELAKLPTLLAKTEKMDVGALGEATYKAMVNARKRNTP